MAIVEGRRQTPIGLSSMRKAFKRSFVAVGGYDRDEGNKVVAEGYCDLVAFGRLFFADLDLPKQFLFNGPLNKYNRFTFYTQDSIIDTSTVPLSKTSLKKRKFMSKLN